jgi:hypothetical protein
MLGAVPMETDQAAVPALAGRRPSENREVTRNPWPRSSRGRSRTGDGAQWHDPVRAMWRVSWPATACVLADLGRRAADLTMHGSLAVREMRSGEGQRRRSRLGLIWAQRTQAVSPILFSTSEAPSHSPLFPAGG